MTGRREDARKVPLLFLAALMAVCPVTQSQQIPMPGLSPSDVPAWFLEAMERETGPFDSQAFELLERSFSAALSAASLSEVQKTGLGWYLTADIEAITPMECWVFTSPIDMAATARNITEQNLTATSRVNGEIVDRATWFADAGVIDGAPFIAAETVYFMMAGDEQRTGFAKVRVARVDDLHMACSHNQIGFRQTFSDNFSQLVRSADFERRPVQPFYRQVYRQSIDGLGLGIIEQSMAIDEDGDLALRTVDSMLVPEASTAASATDSYNLGFFRSGFELINLRAIGSLNGELSYNLNFQPAGEDVYRVVGSAGEQEFDFTIEDEHGPTPLPERMLEIQALLEDPDINAMTFRMWQPEANLGGLTETTIAFENGGKESLLATVTSDGNTTQVQLDEYGSYVNTRFAVELGEFAIERIVDEGQASRLSRNW